MTKTREEIEAEIEEVKDAILERELQLSGLESELEDLEINK